MVPAHSSAAETGARLSSDGPAMVSDAARLQNDAVHVLLVGKLSTARALKATLPNDGAVSQSAPDVILDAQFGSDNPIHLSVVTSQRAALQRVRSEPPRAVLVEVDSRPQSRVRFCRMLRSRAPGTAILAVSDMKPQGSFVFDDFLKQPLSADKTAEAVARLDDQGSGHILRCGSFELNVATRTVHTPDGAQRITPKLCALLELLMARHDEVVSRSEIMESIWETSYLEDTRTLDVHVRWLREAVEPDPSSPVYLLTERGVGYTFRCN